MISILIDSKEDTSFLKAAYEGLEDNKVFVNPTREEVEKVLTENPGERVLLMGHGSPAGLFSYDWCGYVIDRNNVHLLKDREVIGIWCWAKEFARTYKVHGFFSSMFISNLGEYYGILGKEETTDEDIFNETTNFSKGLNTLIREGKAMDTWCDYFKKNSNYERDFVKYNMDGLEYFEKEVL